MRNRASQDRRLRRTSLVSEGIQGKEPPQSRQPYRHRTPDNDVTPPWRSSRRDCRVSTLLLTENCPKVTPPKKVLGTPTTQGRQQDRQLVVDIFRLGNRLGDGVSKQLTIPLS